MLTPRIPDLADMISRLRGDVETLKRRASGRGATGPTGPPGATGPAGPTGPQGPPGDSPNLPVFFGRATAQQGGIVINTWTTVSVPTAAIDDDGMLTGGTATIRRDGVYDIAGGIAWAIPSGNYSYYSALAINGTLIPGSQGPNSSLNGIGPPYTHSGPVPAILHVGDVVSLKGNQNAGTAATFDPTKAAALAPWLKITCIRLTI